MDIDNDIAFGGKKEAQNSSKFIDRYNPQSDSPPVFGTVTEWLNQGREDYNNSTALCFDQTTLSYNQLHKLSNRVANYLIEKGITKGDRVGLCLERSVEMVACVIGILKSGAAYVPLDPHYPLDRLAMMKEDAGMRLLVTHKIFSDRFEATDEKIILWEDAEAEIDACSEAVPSVLIEGEDVAYVIFTSGSTGRPKGIAMPHRALSNLIEWQLERDYFRKEARVLQYSSISFDVSFQEIATTLSSGGTLYLIEDHQRRDPRILLQKLDKWKIERLFIPFVALRSLIKVSGFTNLLPSSLKEVITAGEQLQVDSAVRTFFTKLSDSVLDNQYGPSETHVISAHQLGENPSEWPDLPPIGKPLKNTSIYILDEQMQPVEDGKPGELYLAGRNLAQGYIGRDDLTKKSFVPNPFDKKDRPVLYKTGDLGSYNEEGSIEFLGRADHQIKIRGYRIEPGEINTVGAKFPNVAHCLTQAIDDATGNPRLVTYYVRKNGVEIDGEKFKSHLSKSLPDYMMPAFIMEIEEMPYTPSGKVDLKSLPKPQKKLHKNGELSYQTETEAKLARIWGKLLGFQSIPRSAGFFDLGGDSLLSVTLFLEIEKEFGKALPLSTLVEAPTVKELACLIEGADELDLSSFRSLQRIQKGDKNKTPLFLIHGGLGNVLMFRELAKELNPDIPIFAFQWSGWDGYPGEDDIMEMAKRYKKELRQAWPSGPYRIGGHCIGGIIALKLANLLKAEGAEIVDPVLITDSPNLYSKHYRLDEPESSEAELASFKKLRKELKSKIPPSLKEDSSKKKNDRKSSTETEQLSFPRRLLKLFKGLPVYKPVRRYLKFSYRAIMYPIRNPRETVRPLIIFTMLKLSKPVPIQDRPHYCATAMIRAIKNHGKTVYDGDILYLRSNSMYGRYLGLQGWWNDVFMGFGELCSGQFDAHVIGGRHNEIFTHSYANKLIKEKMLSNNET